MSLLEIMLSTGFGCLTLIESITDILQYRCIPGMNGSGIVSAVGKDIKAFTVGDEVISLHVPGDDRQAAFQEFVVLKENIIAKKLKSLTFEDAASLPYVHSNHADE